MRRFIKERRAEGFSYNLGLSVASAILMVHTRFSQPDRRRKLAVTLLGTIAGCMLYYFIAFEALELTTAVRLCASTTVAVNILFFVTPLKQLFLAVKSLDTS